ncbi:hypothetical protein EJV47_12430 [Hymenobacter gummosus]|uniref:Quercetin 2,3-dioxygenase C-terminal cupin domain-containing protein n=1 Tax=Hymenobacter gummosus TaxID=1776032 RepID=A0A3S0IND4_9BACT|nr:hypothetical protein [Hymenobacter gummosus]RTQ49617.1 hypothetical protein EJV47_12430 [Hymenobacter gummosus]
MLTFPPLVYHSRFLKADRRSLVRGAGSEAYQTAFEQSARLDDLFLRPGASVEVDAAGLGGQLLVLPIVGGALLTAAGAAETALVPGGVYAVPVGPGQAARLTNPFEHETVNLLLIRAPVPAAAGPALQEAELPLTARNVLVAPTPAAWPLRVGLYDSRVKGRIPVSRPAGFALCYVLNGSFEIEDRLVEHRDALLLWNTAAVEFEALSETALLLYLEFGAGH